MNLVDIILILLLACVVVLGIKSTRKHFKGESGCCGGGSGILPEEDKKLENPIIGNKTVKIDGMTCDNCTNRVKKALNKIDGASAIVSLKRGQALVSYDREIADALIVSTIENLGYQVISIE